MKKPVLVIKVSWREFKKMLALARRIYGMMQDNPNFINPNPSLIVMQQDADELEDLIARRGSVRNHGTTADYIMLQNKSKLVQRRLTQLAAWCIGSVDAGLSYSEQVEILCTSGFTLKNPGAPIGALQQVRNFRRLIERNLNLDQIKLKWDKPMEAGYSTNVKSYHIYRSESYIFSTASVIAVQTKTTYIDNPGSGTWYYWVVPVNNMGEGVISQSLPVKIA